jgi:hypothetical protein
LQGITIATEELAQALREKAKSACIRVASCFQSTSRSVRAQSQQRTYESRVRWQLGPDAFEIIQRMIITKVVIKEFCRFLRASLLQHADLSALLRYRIAEERAQRYSDCEVRCSISEMWYP